MMFNIIPIFACRMHLLFMTIVDHLFCNIVKFVCFFLLFHGLVVCLFPEFLFLQLHAANLQAVFNVFQV